MKEQTREEPKILAAAERQMQVWAHLQEVADQTAVQPGASPVGPYLTVSREAGAGGAIVAQSVGTQLDWEVLDKNILDQVADRCHTSRSMLDLVDETSSNWAYDVLGPWLDRQIVPHDKYVAHLIRVVLIAARRGKVVLVGRGAQFLLPPRCGLAVRIIAPRKYRIQQIADRNGISAEEAELYIDDVDHGRREFVQRYFHQDIDDPHLYDLVINVERLGPDCAAAQIIDALRRAEFVDGEDPAA